MSAEDSFRRSVDNQALLVQRLCYEVYRNPCVWDKYSHENKCLRIVEAGWRRIAQRMGLPVALCQKRFRNLRDGYVKKRRKAGGVFPDKIYWGLSWYLRFLDNIPMTPEDFGLSNQEWTANSEPNKIEQMELINDGADIQIAEFKHEMASVNGEIYSELSNTEDDVECITSDPDQLSIPRPVGGLQSASTSTGNVIENDHCHSVALILASYLRMMPDEVRGVVESKLLSLCVAYAYNLPVPKLND